MVQLAEWLLLTPEVCGSNQAFRNYFSRQVYNEKEAGIGPFFTTALNLLQDFDARFQVLSEFLSGQIYTSYTRLGHFHIEVANLQMETNFVPQIMHQN